MSFTIPTVESCRDRSVSGATFAVLSWPTLLAHAGVTTGPSGWVIPDREACRDG